MHGLTGQVVYRAVQRRFQRSVLGRMWIVAVGVLGLNLAVGLVDNDLPERLCLR